jgi:hypothetical protein
MPAELHVGIFRVQTPQVSSWRILGNEGEPATISNKAVGVLRSAGVPIYDQSGSFFKKRPVLPPCQVDQDRIREALSQGVIKLFPKAQEILGLRGRRS